MGVTENDIRRLCDQYRDKLYNKLVSRQDLSSITPKNSLIVKCNMIVCVDKVYKMFKKSLMKNKKRARDEEHDTENDSDQDNMEY